MSIESFLHTYPPGAELVGLVQRKAEERNHSNVRTLLHEFVREGRDGIGSIERTLKNRGIDVYRGGGTSAPITQAERRSFDVNHAGILFGLSGIAIESALVEQVFDVNEFCGLYDESLRGTALSSVFNPTEDSREQLTPDRWRQMIAIADRDKTFAAFFYPKGWTALPTNLQIVIQEMKLLPVIRQDILPEYRTRAESLVAPQPLTR
ncbi:MAG: hypothetical protein M1372_00910 [Patescibacteria group bacterium]|nr:hypothetical protein [Patescibacteria group bacterium]